MDFDPRARDLAIRTILGEAAQEPDEGQQAVAAVMLNRLQSGRFGKSLPEVILARHQFEPWSTQSGRSRMFGYASDSAPYQRAAAAFDAAVGGADPTRGATHFFSPTAQAQLGRQPPSWAQGERMDIGRHAFFAPEGRVMRAQAQSQEMPPLPPGFKLVQGDAAPAANGMPPLPPGFKLLQSEPPASFEQRFATPPVVNSEMEAGLRERSKELTRGPAQSPVSQMATEAGNVMSAASQRTVPHVGQYKGRVVSVDLLEDDAGNIQYRDPQTGAVQYTDNSKHVILTDPADGRRKVFERSDETDENRFAGAARVLAPGLASGAATRRAALTEAPKNITRASEVASTAKPYYREFTKEAAKIEVPPATGEGIADRFRAALDRVNLDVEMAGKPAAAAIRMVESGKEGMTLDYLQRVKRFASRGFGSSEKDVRDGAAAIASEISKIIQEVSPSASKNLKTGDAIHSTSLAVRELQQKQDIAGLRTGRAGYSGNAVNNMRQVLSPIVEKSIKGEITKFKPDEIAAMREITEGNWATNTLRQIGALSPSKGIMSIGAGVPTLGASWAIGGAANKWATILTGKQIDRLREMVAKRSPAYEAAVTKAAERYEKAQIEFANEPTTAKFAAYLSASRALSAGLTRDGIPVASGDLLRAIRGPMQSAAEGEEPAVPGLPGE